MPIKKSPTYQHADIIIDIMMEKSGLSQTKLAKQVFGVTGVNLTRARSSGKITGRWFIEFEKKYGITKEELIQQAKEASGTNKIAATITPGRICLAEDLPINKLTPLKLLTAWMNETFTGEMGEVQAMQFYESIKKDYPSFKQFIEKRVTEQTTDSSAENAAG